MDDQKLITQEIRGDVKLLVERTHEMDKKLAIHNTLLDQHMRRTAANEDRIKRLEDFKWYFAGIAVIMTVAVEMFRRFL